MSAGPVIRLHGIANCDTVKQARAWLTQQGVAHEFHDFKRQGLSPALLDAWLAALPLARLLNRAGSTWRRLPEAERAAADANPAVARTLLLAQPSLVKRPVLQWPDGALSVGFDAADWLRRISR